MKVIFESNIEIEVENCNFKSITKSFLLALAPVFASYVTKILLHYFQQYYRSGKLRELLKSDRVRLKTSNKKTKFKTLFGDIMVPQIQVRVYDSQGQEHQKSVTRLLLGVSPKYQIPDFMKELMGWIGSVSTFRVGSAIVGGLTGFRCSLTGFWKSAQWYAGRIKLKLSPKGTNEFEADATGIPTRGTGKRGSELKKVFQRKENGKLHLVGMSIGKYKNKDDWKSAMSNLTKATKSGLKKYSKLVLASDGDLSIIDVAKGISKKIKIQKDKWHVFHQLKYYLWKDGVGKELKNSIIGHFYKLTMLSSATKEKRDSRIDRYIGLLAQAGYKSTSVYLSSAMDGFYTHEQEGNANTYTSRTERSMRTTNQRTNVGTWSDDGALSVCKIRDAYYYNGISPLNWKNTG